MPMPMSNALEQRMTRLEETCAFQEKTIEDLNEALTLQQHQLDTQDKRLKAAEQCLQDLRELLTRDGGENTGPPPHYGALA